MSASNARTTAAAALIIAALFVACVVDLSDVAVKTEAVSGRGRAVSLLQSKAGRRRQSLWIVPDNGVVTTINTRGYVNAEGTISYNPNFVYGSAGTPVIQPDPTSDQWWRYSDEGYRFITGPSSGGFTPNYELINAGPMESDGSEWGYKPVDGTPTYDYFPQTFYPSSGAYNYPGAPIAAGVEKEAYQYTYGKAGYADYGKVKGPAEEPFTGIA